MPVPNIGELAATTLRSRTGKAADNVSKGNALFFKLKEKGSWKPAAGRTILQEVEFAENAGFMWYSGYEELNIGSTEVVDAFEYNWKQAAVPVSASGLETEVQNA